MALTVGELNAYLKLDDGTWKSSLDAAGAEFQRFKSRIDVQLEELERSFKEMSAEVKITADTRQAEKDVKAFIRRMNALKISINVNVAVAAALTRLQQVEDRVREISRLSASVRVSADSGEALAALRAIRDLITRINGSRPSVTVNANTARAEAALRRLDQAQRDAGNSRGLAGISASLDGVSSAAGSAASSLAGAASTAGLIAAALGAAIPAAAGLVAMLAQIAPAAAVGATAVFSIGSAVGALKLGTGGVGSAFKAAFAPAVSGGGGAAKSANQAASAMRAVKDATQQAAYANQAAARQVSDAERNVADAQKAARAAQLDLNAAREQATRDLQDLNDQLADARLDERSATADVTTALEALNSARQHGTGPGTDLDALQLAYDQAVQKLKEAREQTQRLQEDTTKANKAGVDGSQTMIDARQKIADANRTESDQERALSDARVQQARTAAAGQESIQKAVEALNAAGASAGGGGGGVNALATALAKLSPNARAFVMQVIALKGAWTSMQQAVQQKLFEGLAGTLKVTAAAVLPVLRKGLVDSAGALNLMAKGAMTAAAGVAKDGTLGKALASASVGLHNLAGIPGIAVKALTQLAAAGGPAFQQLTAAAGRGAASIGQKLSDAYKSGRLKTAIDYAVSLIKQIGQVAANVGRILGDLFAPANASGAGFLGTLKTITGALADGLGTPAAQKALGSLFQTMALIGRTVGPLLVTALQAIAPVLTILAPPVQQLVTALGGALGPILTGLGPVLVIAARAFGQLLTGFQPLIGALPQLIGPITAVVSALASSGPAIGLLVMAFNPFLGILILLAPVLGKLVGPIGLLVTGLSPLIAAVGAFAGKIGAALVPVVTALVPVLALLGGAVGDLFGALSPLLPILGQMIAALGPVLSPILAVIGDLFTALAPVVAQLGKSLLPPFLKITQSLSRVFGELSPVLADALTQLGSGGLVPIIAALGTVIGDLVDSYAVQFVRMFELLLPVIPLLIPVVVQLAQSLSQILVSLAPLLPQIMLLSAQMITQLLPAIIPLIGPLTQLEILFLQLATGVITKVVIPSLGALIRVMGTLRRAFQVPLDAVTWLTNAIARAFEWLADHLVGHSVIPDMIRSIVSWFARLPGMAWSALSGLAGRIAGRATDAGNQMVAATRRGLSSAVSWLSGLPGRAANVLGDLSGVLWRSGQSLLKGFIDGIKSMGGVVSSAVSGIVSGARDFFPFSPARRGAFSGRGYPLYSGQAIGASLAAGMTSRAGLVSGAARALAASAQHGLGVPGTPMGALTTPPPGAAGYRGQGGSYGAAGSGSQAPTRVVIDLIGADSAVVKAVRKRVRVSGGSAQVVLGKAV